MTEAEHKKNKPEVEVRVAGPKYQEKDPMQAIMERLDENDKGTPPKKLSSIGKCHNH